MTKLIPAFLSFLLLIFLTWKSNTEIIRDENTLCGLILYFTFWNLNMIPSKLKTTSMVMPKPLRFGMKKLSMVSNSRFLTNSPCSCDTALTDIPWWCLSGLTNNMKLTSSFILKPHLNMEDAIPNSGTRLKLISTPKGC